MRAPERGNYWSIGDFMGSHFSGIRFGDRFQGRWIRCNHPVINNPRGSNLSGYFTISPLVRNPFETLYGSP